MANRCPKCGRFLGKRKHQCPISKQYKLELDRYDEQAELVNASDLIIRLERLEQEIKEIRQEVEDKKVELLKMLDEKSKELFKKFEKIENFYYDLRKELRFIKREYYEAWWYKR